MTINKQSTTASKYEALDKLLLARIARAPAAFADLQEAEILAAAEPFTVPDRFGVNGPAWRILDRRLQALRKQDRIEHVKGLWCIKGTGRLL